jgi:hypothetical protein
MQLPLLLSPAPISGDALTTFTKRENRLALASQIVGRQIDSFTELHKAEAGKLIDVMKRALGQKVRAARNIPDRDQAQAYGTAGRRGHATKEIRLVDDQTMELLDSLIAQLGWTRERFDAFLRSGSSPVHGGSIRTLQQANKVIWALRNMVRRQVKRAG